jgi:DNA-directed RNA polymerase specialized sigma24 family protein
MNRFQDFKVTDADAPLIDRMKPEHREVLRATGKYEEIAANLRLSVGTVKSRINRARHRLVRMRAEQAGR